jgi:hypothetical protein
MIDERRIREMLIESCHTSAKARQFFESRLRDAELLNCLVEIAVDTSDFGGDAPMEAAHYLSRFPAEMIEKHENKLIAALPLVSGYGGAIALALGKAKSLAAKALIRRELGDGQRFDAWMFREALAHYGQDKTT